MTPYIKKIVELHKIHKAIEEKDCCSGGGGNTPSGDITIDDVVKFIHDDFVKNGPPFMSELFPYTTWDDIPDYEDVSNGDFCKTNDDDGKAFTKIVLYISNYIIGTKYEKFA